MLRSDLIQTDKHATSNFVRWKNHIQNRNV